MGVQRVGVHPRVNLHPRQALGRLLGDGGAVGGSRVEPEPALHRARAGRDADGGGVIVCFSAAVQHGAPVVPAVGTGVAADVFLPGVVGLQPGRRRVVCSASVLRFEVEVERGTR
mgnify:CR=1 FL=1